MGISDSFCLPNKLITADRISCHSVHDRAVSIGQPYIRPIIRGKAAAPVEFGAKRDLSLCEKGMARIEKLSFDAYNENDVLTAVAERYYEITGTLKNSYLYQNFYDADMAR